MSSTKVTQQRIRNAIQDLHVLYRKNPWIFMTEADVQCALYGHLLNQFASQPIRSKIRSRQTSKIIHDFPYKLRTVSVHAEIFSSKRRKGKFVDLQVADPRKISFYVSKKSIDPEKGKYYVHHIESDTSKDVVGIEIKFNRWHTNPKNKTFKNLRNGLVKDFHKLRAYHRGWLVFVDQLSAFDSRESIKTFLEDAMRRANYGRLKSTLNFYYMSPRNKWAATWKNKWHTRDS